MTFVNVLFSQSSSQGVVTEDSWKYAEKNGFTKIAPRQFVGFQPRADKKRVYITIVTHSGVVVYNSLPKEEDKSLVVDQSANIKPTKYGQLWVDESGVRYSKGPVCSNSVDKENRDVYCVKADTVFLK